MSVHRFTVPFAFPVIFTSDVWDPDNRSFADVLCRREPDRRHRVMVAIDQEVAGAHGTLLSDIDDYFARFARSLDLVTAPVIMPGGEAVKNDLAHCLRFLGHINDAGMDRQSVVTVIGGGAVLDTVSFACAIAHRGIRLVRMPTTVLSQADSGIAVKNGMNLFGKKNFIGTFVPPFAVINDARFLETLSLRDRISGIAEAVKVGLLKDPALYREIESRARAIARGDLDAMSAIIRRSAELHLAHICGNGDPFELGSSRPLDFGHWAAHKLESMSGHRLRHGEAVAIGMALDILYSVNMAYLDPSVADAILDLLERIGFRLWDRLLIERDGRGELVLVEGLREFREHLGGELHVTLLRDVGETFDVSEIDDDVLSQSIEDLSRRAGMGRAHPEAARV